MITVALSTTICASHDRVWRTLADPAQRPLWDERVLGEVKLSADSASKSRSRRRSRESARKASETPSAERLAPLRSHQWRFRLGGVPLVMQEELLSSDPLGRLMSRVAIGTMHFDQTLSLLREDDESGPRTRLGMKLIAHNSIAVIGELVPRLSVQKIVIEYVDTTLRQVQKFCEQQA